MCHMALGCRGQRLLVAHAQGVVMTASWSLLVEAGRALAGLEIGIIGGKEVVEECLLIGQGFREDLLVLR